MKEEKLIRQELVFHLLKGNAHMTFEEAVAGFPDNKFNTKFPNGDYSFWHLLEHIRRTQFDILDFIRNSNYQERDWPKDFWPARLASESVADGPEKGEKATQADWDRTIKSFLKDRKALQKLVGDPSTDLYTKISHGTGQTIFREILLVADHNAYHIGEFAIMRQVLNCWRN